MDRFLFISLNILILGISCAKPNLKIKERTSDGRLNDCEAAEIGSKCSKDDETPPRNSRGSNKDDEPKERPDDKKNDEPSGLKFADVEDLFFAAKKGNCKLCHDEGSKFGVYDSYETLADGQAAVLNRLKLDRDDKELMPPEGTGELDDDDIEKIQQWYDDGANE